MAGLEDQPAGEIEYWPLNNSCCDRAAVLESADDLAHALSYGDQLIVALRASGHKVYFEPEAALSHLNISRWKEWLDENWIGGHLVCPLPIARLVTGPALGLCMRPLRRSPWCSW